MAHEFANNYKSEMTIPQSIILFIIRDNGPLKVTALAEQMGVKPSAISVMIDRLVLLDFVVRLPDHNDRRVVLLQITDAGRAASKRLEEQNNELIGQYFSKLSVDEIENMLVTLEKIIKD
ncbi:MarR family winged helix-turn-helix transcriptional regulator [Paenibacillus sepulcri]|uniref:MarR family transcriptional regulator n=1 Tax=Paenibacillus sepulcri TaxID=359917 RepID=A0ABS7C1S3_9BACL|nr:MarR family transcriptional regulator [Paenibacillus sepulcri]